MRLLPTGASRNGRSDWGAKYRVCGARARNGDALARAECHAFERTAVLPKRDLAFGSAVDIVENHAGKTTFSEAPQVADIDDVRRRKPRHIRCQSA